MKVSEFDTRIVELPREKGPLSGGSPGAAGFIMVLLRMRTDDGVEGVGYAGQASRPMTKALKSAVDALAQQAVGRDPMEVDAVTADLMRLGGDGAPAGLVTHAVSAIDVALWDLRGKALGQPVHKLLGGNRDRVPAYASGGLWRSHSLDSLAERARGFVDRGFTALKLRMGGESRAADEMDRMRVTREAVGDDFDIMIDVNQGWSVSQSIEMGRRLEEYHPYWLEDPVHHQDLAGQAQVAQALDTPVAAGEYHYGTLPFGQLIERRAIDIAIVDLFRAGGITPWMKIAHAAEVFNVPVASHVAPEVLVHTMAAIPNALTVEYMPWAFEVFQETPKVEGGMILAPQSPGLGLELDEDAVTRYQVD